MTNVVEIEPGFIREVISVKIDESTGCEVTFRCGHVVYFAVPVLVGQSYYCSVCFHHFLRKLKAAR